MPKYKNLLTMMMVLLIMVFIVVLVKTAWVSDDAYITFRSVENFIHGYGMVFNVEERVQTYTHPLWFFLQSILNFLAQKLFSLNFWSQMFYINVGLSILISVITVVLLVYFLSKSHLQAVIVVLILASSKAFVDYSTSGLENPLSHLITVLFYLIFLNREYSRSKKLYLLSLIAGIGAINRLDTILVFIPPIIFVILTGKISWKDIKIILLGFIPLAVWELFSLWYYGSLFPNTAYSKLNTGLSRLELTNQGLKYFLDSLFSDPITLIVISTGLVLMLIKPKQLSPYSFSVLLYMGYIFMIGGDFMSGRFFSLPLLITTIAISQEPGLEKLPVFSGVAIVGMIYFLANPASPAWSTKHYGDGNSIDYIRPSGIADERAVYYPTMGLLTANRKVGFPGSKFSSNKWIYAGMIEKVVLLGPLGVEGYMLGPNVHVIDLNGLADPLMSRMPLTDPTDWRIGHYKHQIPEGYLETLSTGKNMISNPYVAEYYDKIRLITRGNLFSTQRVKEIIRFSLGQYDYLLDCADES